MSYSACDFCDDVTDAFAGAGLIGDSLPDGEEGIAVASERLCALARVLGHLNDADTRAATLRVEPQPPAWFTVLTDPATSYALRDTMLAFEKRDPVDALADAEMLVALMRTKLAKPQPTCRSCGGGYGEGDGQDGLCFTCADQQYKTKVSS